MEWNKKDYRQAEYLGCTYGIKTIRNPSGEIRYQVCGGLGKDKRLIFKTFKTLDEAEDYARDIITKQEEMKKWDREEKEKGKEFNEKYPSNIISDLGCKFDNLEDAIWHWEERFEGNLDRFLTDERIRQMMMEFYRDYKTLVVIGSEFYLTRERIRQLIAKGIRRIKNRKEFYDICAYGKDAVEEIKEKKKDVIQLISDIEKLKRQLIEKRKYLEQCIGQEIKLSEKLAETLNYVDKNETKISELGLSPRAENALRRAGIFNVREIIGLGVDGLMHIRNLGLKSTTEVLDKLEGMGIYIPNISNTYHRPYTGIEKFQKKKIEEGRKQRSYDIIDDIPEIGDFFVGVNVEKGSYDEDAEYIYSDDEIKSLMDEVFNDD